jgi:hypothetical protein
VTPATPTATSPPGGSGYRIPSLGYRILVSGLRLIPLLVLLVGLPVGLLSFLNAHGLSIPIAIGTVTTFGIVLSVLAALRYVVKPTRAYGPVSIVASAAAVLYLWVLLQSSPFHFTIPGTSVAFGLGFRDLVLGIMLVPAFGLAAGIVTTVEDARSPHERLPFDYPA